MTESTLDAPPPRHVARRCATGRRVPQAIRYFRRGRLVLLAALLHGGPLPFIRLAPEPWPNSLDPPVGGQPEAQPHQGAVAQKRST
ncbi:MAG: hypothetical protein KatS3mg058_2840 [Roseiflexus sp.]|nr:MAG: hypothetical protein KatS3mg058_2840 [Roseiflexus sp.]